MANASFDGEDFPTLGGRGAAADSEQSCDSGDRGTKPWHSSQRSGQSAWSSQIAAPSQTKWVPVEKSDHPGRGFRTAPPTNPPRPSENFRAEDRRAPHGDRQRVCCHFLEQGHCNHGKACNFKHTRDVDPAWTLCGFGERCKFNHGKFLIRHQDASRDQIRALNGDQNARACCHFFEGKCAKGAACKYRHVNSHKSSTTLCGYGISCQFGHGATILEATDTLGNDNPLVCCHFLETGRCFNGPECKYRHERVAAKWTVQCGFGQRCKYNHGAYVDEEYCRSCDADQGYSARRSVATARYTKAPDTPPDNYSQSAMSLKAVPEASTKDSDNAASTEELISARETAAEDIIGALEQAWEDVWAPTAKSAPVEPSKDAVPVGVQVPQVTEQVSSVREKPKTTVVATVVKRVPKQLPDWLSRPRRRARPEERSTAAIDEAESGQKPPPRSADPDNYPDAQDQGAAASLSESDDNREIRNKKQVSFSGVDFEAVKTDPQPAADEEVGKEAKAEEPQALNEVVVIGSEDINSAAVPLLEDSATTVQSGEVKADTDDDEDDDQHLEEDAGQEADDDQVLDPDTLVERCIRQQVACCHFLRGFCQFGEHCHYRHDWGLDPTCTECEYGESCAHGHGWYTYAMQRISKSQPWVNDAGAGEQKVAGPEESLRRQAFAGDKVHDRACCMFLEYAACPAGLKCPFKHVLSDPARTLCNYGTECLHEHGWSLHFEKSPRAKATPPVQSTEPALFEDEQTKTPDLTTADEKDHEANEHKDLPIPVPPAIPSEEEERRVLRNSSSINRVKRGRACCKFLEHWHCRNGDLCQLQHVQCPPRLTLCQYGTKDCFYGHGWARQDANEQRQLDEKTPCTITAGAVDTSGSNLYPLYPNEKMLKGEDMDNAGKTENDISDGTENRTPHSDGVENRLRERICCYYLQYWNCKEGDNCKYRHVKSDPATTFCGFGSNRCRYEHGWARGLKFHVAEQGFKSENDSENRVCSRVCRNFLDGASGDRGGTGYRERRQADRTAWLGGGDAAAGVRIPNAPTKLLRAALTGLLGWWNSTRSDKTVQCHQVTMQLPPAGRGTAFLVCITTTKDEETSERIRVEGGDIVLGANGEFFLDSSTNHQVTWVNKNKRELTRHWVRGWAAAGEEAQEDDTEEVLLKSAFHFQ